ncbi:MAG TPA: RNA polymerase sigma factor [Galbitalea sp.]
MTTDSDEVVWAAALEGDGEAFGRIFDRHRSRLYRHSYRLVPVAADADDVVAIAFFESWRRRDVARFVDGSMLPWLLVIATNSARNLARGERRYKALLAKLPAGEHSRDHAEDIDDVARAALAKLSLPDRQVIALCVLDGYSEKEAAAALGVAPGTIKSRLSRAKARLAGQLEAHATPLRSLAKEANNEA